MFEFFKTRKRNQNETLRRYYSKASKSCNTCKYCYEKDNFMGYVNYTCRYKDPDFPWSEKLLCQYSCKQYKPTRKYKNYLEGKYEPVK